MPDVVNRTLQHATPLGLAFRFGFALAVWWLPQHGAGAEDAISTLPAIGESDTSPALHYERFEVPPPGQVKSGTAFFVSRDGKALTSAHVVQNCEQITIWMEDATPRISTIIGVDPDLDIALLASPGAVYDIADFQTSMAARTGETVTTIGFGIRQHEPLWSQVTSGTVFGQAVLPSGSHVLVVNAALKQGNSGGPVIDNTGNVLGLVIGRYTARPELNVAVPASVLGKFLAHHGVSPASSDSVPGDGTTGHSSAGIRGRLERISALVQCKPRRTSMPVK